MANLLDLLEHLNAVCQFKGYEEKQHLNGYPFDPPVSSHLFDASFATAFFAL